MSSHGADVPERPPLVISYSPVPAHRGARTQQAGQPYESGRPRQRSRSASGYSALDTSAARFPPPAAATQHRRSRSSERSRAELESPATSRRRSAGHSDGGSSGSG